VVASLRALLDGSLDSGDALRLEDFLLAKSGETAWCLGDLRCPVSMLDSLGKTLLAHCMGVSVSICTTSTDGERFWGEARVDDAVKMNEFLKVGENVAEICSYSVRLHDLAKAETQFDDLRGFASANVEVRLPVGLQDIEDVTALASEREFLSLAYPATFEGLADLIAECMNLEVPFKALELAGSAYSHQETIGTISVLGASVLTFSEDLSRASIDRILRSKSTDDWQFTDEGISWQDLFASTSQIIEARTIATGIQVNSLSLALREISRL
jgi:hypothetical protein